MTVEEKRRELFEANIPIPSGVVWDKNLGGYVGENFWLVDYAWTAFNAVLDAIEIKLPSGRVDSPQDYWGGITDAKTAVESLKLGIKVKP